MVRAVVHGCRWMQVAYIAAGWANIVGLCKWYFIGPLLSKLITKRLVIGLSCTLLLTVDHICHVCTLLLNALL